MNFKPEPKALRQFAWFAIVGLPLLAFLVLRLCGAFTWSHPAMFAAAGLAVVQLALFLAGIQAVTRWTFVGLMVLAAPIGFVVSNVMLAIVYWLVITPIGLLFRLVGRDAIGRKWDAKATTYWHVRGAPRPKASYFKLY
ncbi:MAG: hypothetical protein JNK15_09075 [Planctomycetes bacterium]|nr:hypothetical protein [Planctomycetota bacterium]